MTTITCPACGRSFILKHKPDRIFTCPKCAFNASFATVLANRQNVRQPDPTVSDLPDTSSPGLPTDPGIFDKTKVMTGLGGDRTQVVPGLGSGGGRTQVVDNLQPKKFGFKVTFGGRQLGTVTIPMQAQFTMGRKSSDSTADVKLAPDLSMSRVHAGMRIVVFQGGTKGFQITSAKDSNPVYVNGQPVAKGKAVNLKLGDRLRMGETDLVFGRY